MMNVKKYLKDFLGLLNREFPTEMLVKRGMDVGENFKRFSGCFIDPSHCCLIKIGNNVTMSVRCILLAHDASTWGLMGYAKIGRIVIEDNVFIGAGSIILPNVVIGEGSIVGAGSVVSRDIPPGSVVAGNPAKIICSTEEFVDRHRRSIEGTGIRFEQEYKMKHGKLDDSKKREMLNSLNGNIGYIR